MVVGYHIETTTYDSELDKQLDNLRFLCTDLGGFNEQKYNCYKEQLLTGYSSEKIRDNTVFELEKEEMMIPVDLPLASMVGGPKDTPWPMKCHDVRHTSQSPYSTASTTSLEKWRFYSSGWVKGGIAIDSDGTIYFGGAYNHLDRYLYAVYPDGSLKWMYNLGGIIWSTPAINEDGTIYIGSYSTHLYAINPNGTLKWIFSSGGGISSSPAIAKDGTIYFGNMIGLDRGDIIAVNPNGTEKWRYPTGYYIVSDPAIGDDGTIYIGSGDNYLYALYPNGTLRWRFKTGDWIKAHPSIADDGTVYISSFDGYLYALYPNGTLKWKYSGGGDEASPAIDKDGIIYVGNDKLRAIYPNGTEKWSINVAGGNIDHASPAISVDGTIYVGAGCNIVAINPDGTERWRKKIANMWVESSPSINDDGTVYIGSAYEMSRGYLHAFGNVESNSPPGTPSISGTTNGIVGEDYWYTFVAHDPDNNPIQLFVDWDDSDSGWVDWFASDETMWAEHRWTTQGTYTISAKVKDVMGEESDLAELVVTMPRSRAINGFFLRFLEQFPILHRLLSLIRV
jgi:outer membrane protein assembly factor BamB